MIVCRVYDEEKKIDKIWYNSSSIVYSECEDRENELKLLKVVFKGGGTYLYKDVDVNDYVMFVHGGLDGSNGKALNQYIKPKCEFEKLENTDLSSLEEELNKALKKKEESAEKS